MKKTTKIDLPRQAVASIAFMLPTWIFAWSTNSLILCVIAAAIGTLIGATWFWGMLADKNAFFHQLSLGAVSLMTILNAGFLFAWGAATFGLDRAFEDTFRIIGVGYSSYALAVIYATAFSLVLAALTLMPFIRNSDRRLAESVVSLQDSLKLSSLLWLALVFVLIDFALISSGVLGFRSSGLTNQQSGRVSFLMPLIDIAIALQIPLAALILVLSGKREHSSWIGLGAGLCLAAVIAFVYFSKGRGSFVLAVSLLGIYWCIFRGARPSWKLALPIALAFYLLAPRVLVFHESIRNLRGTNSNAASMVVGALAAEDQSESASRLRSLRSLNNLAGRPLVATPLAKCIAMSEGLKETTGGRFVIANLAWAIPRALFPEKVRFSAMEGLLYQHFPDPSFLFDTADSVYLYSYADFGFLGILLGPLLLGVIWSIQLFMLLTVCRSGVARGLLFCLWPPLFILSIGEGAWLNFFVTLRTSMMLSLVLCLAENVLNSQPSFKSVTK